MATTANLSSILKYYADKQKSGFVDFKEFCAYIKKYAEHHVEEQGELVKYLGDPSNTVMAELQGLSEKHLVSVITANNKKTIVVISYFSSKYTAQYTDIQKTDAVPFPLVTDLPKLFPLHAVEKQLASAYIPNLIEKKPVKSGILYFLEFSQEIPALILPECIPMVQLIEAAQAKIRKILKKEEYHDYFLKKLRSTNASKEISIQGFYSKFVDANENNFSKLADGDDYYFWNQLLYFIKQDFIKIQDKTTEDINILQAVQIAEVHSTYLKEKFQQIKKKEDALKEFEAALDKTPYFFSMKQILKFQDKSGKTLYGKYTEDDLKETLQRLTTEGESNELPPLLVFKVPSGTRYFIYKKNVIQVIVRLCNEARNPIEKQIEDKWYNALINYDKLPEMTSDPHFENELHYLVEENSPVLYALLNANFMTLLAYDREDSDTSHGFQLFVDGKIMAYRDLLMLKNSKILSNAKMRLPFYYSIPVISWFLSFFGNGKKNKQKKSSKPVSNQTKTASLNPLDNLEEEHTSNSIQQKSRKDVLAARAKEISAELIPEGSSLDRELNYLEKQWNKMISKEAYNMLSEDINALIRDYTRRVIRTLSSTTFTKERIQNLAVNLVDTPNMQKVGASKALTEYVTLYMLRLITNK